MNKKILIGAALVGLWIWHKKKNSGTRPGRAPEIPPEMTVGPVMPPGDVRPAWTGWGQL